MTVVIWQICFSYNLTISVIINRAAAVTLSFYNNGLIWQVVVAMVMQLMLLSVHV
jgi:hypothetical protein